MVACSKLVSKSGGRAPTFLGNAAERVETELGYVHLSLDDFEVHEFVVG